MRTVVTGAAGFIGSHLSARLLDEGHDVLGIDNFDDFYDPRRKEANVEALSNAAGWTFEKGDIRDSDFLRRILRDRQVVVHLAARAGVRPSFERPSLYKDVNVRGTAELLEAAALSGVSRFVFGSSSSVYGEGASVPFKEDNPLGTPASPYASTKVAGERLCHDLRSKFENVVVLRFFTVYGPRQRPDLAIHKFAGLLSEDKPIPVYGNLDSYRDYTYVDDIVQGVLAALKVETGWSVINLGSGRPVTLNEMIEAVEQAMGKKAVREELPHQEGDLDGTWADISEANRVLGYSPTWSFGEGVGSFIEWFRSEV